MKQFSGKALLVEDNLINQKVARGILSNLGLTVDIASNGKAGVEMFQREDYDVIFMDCEMPVMNGYDAARIILDLDTREQKRPIIALTANALEQNKNRCKEVGMSYFITKPVNVEELTSLLTQVFESTTKQETTCAMNDSENLTFNRNALDTLAELMDTEDFDELIPAFLQSTQETFTELEQAIAADERKTIQRIAHSLKSASANLGAMQLSATAAELEARAQEINNFNDTISQLKSEFVAVKQALQSYQSKAA